MEYSGSLPEKFQQKRFKKIILLHIVLAAVLIFGLYFSSIYNYILFHTTAELVSIIIACAVFMLAWNARKYMDNGYLLFFGITSLFVAGIDFLHTLSYKGMPIFVGFTANLPTQLWIAMRFMQAVSFLIAPIFFRKKLDARAVFIWYSIATLILVASTFLGIFPDAFIEGEGLTKFKIFSEYAIIAIFAVSLLLLYKNRNKFDKYVFGLLAAAIASAIFSELAFTLYISVYGFSNFVGHIFEIAQFYLIYLAIIQTGLSKPYSLLFKELHDSNKLKDLFIDIMGHDILNPAGAIKLRVEAAIKQEADPKKKENLEKIREDSYFVIRMLKDARRLALMSDPENSNFEEQDVAVLMDKAIRSMEPMASKKKQEIRLLGKGKFPAKVNTLMYDAFRNILSNAVKYSPKNSPITVRIMDKRERLQVRIADKGIGIPDEYKKTIFERFSRLHREGVKGSGLGLAIVKEVVNIHKGRAWVEDNKGKGSVFVIEIPKRA